MKELSDKDAKRFATVDYVERVALVLEAERTLSKERFAPTIIYAVLSGEETPTVDWAAAIDADDDEMSARTLDAECPQYRDIVATDVERLVAEVRDRLRPEADRQAGH